MVFQSLKDFLRGNSARFENLERRLRRIEYEISRMSFAGGNGQEKTRKNKQKTVDRKKRELSKRGDTVYTQRGWTMPRKKTVQGGKAPEKIGAKKRLIFEFQCPNCGKINSSGIKHSHMDEINGHTDYHMYFKCSNCGWESDLVSIRATN